MFRRRVRRIAWSLCLAGSVACIAAFFWADEEHVYRIERDGPRRFAAALNDGMVYLVFTRWQTADGQPVDFSVDWRAEVIEPEFDNPRSDTRR